jgi:hypothetical protein
MTASESSHMKVVGRVARAMADSSNGTLCHDGCSAAIDGCSEAFGDAASKLQPARCA